MPARKTASRTRTRAKQSASKSPSRTKSPPQKKAAAKPARQKPSPIRGFATQDAFRKWLDENHDKSSGIWLRIAKKGSGVKSVTYPEALDVLLCYGWIDAIKLPESDKSWLQRVLPRRPKSIWSKINREKALGLIGKGHMHAAGHAEIERAKADGRWESAYDSPSNATVDPEFQARLDRSPKAKAFFETLSRTNRYAILWRIQTAKKPETRQARINTYIEMLENEKVFH
ncbi:MAG: YdeI/OmpD-associated family protein [Gemmatimonadaceae bacterium]